MGLLDSIGNIFLASQAQKEQTYFAKHGIHVKVNDAKASGINPYFALGASTTMPGSVVGNVSGLDDTLGQNISRAEDAGKTADGRDNALAEKFGKLQIENQELQNASLKADIAKKTAQLAPAVPSLNQNWFIPGQGETAVKNEPMKRTVTGDTPGTDPASVNEIGYTQNPDGTFNPVPSKEAMERQSNDMIGMLQWNLRNRILPMFQGWRKMPFSKDGEYYSYNPVAGTYSPSGLRDLKK